jgi:hypothetical protein
MERRVPKTVPQKYGEASGALTCFVGGADFDLPGLVTLASREMGIAVTGDICVIYGDLKINTAGPNVGIDFGANPVAPVFNVDRGIVVDQGVANPQAVGILSIAAGTSTITIRKADKTAFALNDTIKFGQTNWVRG